MVFYRQSSYKKIIKYLKKHGFKIKQGGSHAKATNDGVLLVIPRHNKISSGVVSQISKALVEECGHNKEDVERALK